MNNFDKVKLTVKIFQDLKLLNTSFHQKDLKKKGLYDEWLSLYDYCRAIIYSAGNSKIYQREFDIPQMSEYLDDYILNEKYIIETEKSYI